MAQTQTPMQTALIAEFPEHVARYRAMSRDELFTTMNSNLDAIDTLPNAAKLWYLAETILRQRFCCHVG